MRTLLRVLGVVLRVVAGVVAIAAVAGWWFLYAPKPEPPSGGDSITRDSVRVGGRTRRWATYVPRRRAPDAPLVLALHGSMGNAEQMRLATGYGFERLAERDGFVLVYPEGFEGHWNDCRKEGPYSAKRLRVDDVGFLRALVRQLRATRSVDSSRVFAVGLSNGAHMVYRLALEAPDLVRAVAAVGGSLPAPENVDCAPVPGATSVMIVNGTADPINPYEGGRVTLFGFGDRGRVLSSRASAEYFARRIGASASPVVDTIPQPADAGPTSVERAVWRAGGGAEVRLYTVHAGGHTVPQPYARAMRLFGPTHRALDATAEIWAFFAATACPPSTTTCAH